MSNWSRSFLAKWIVGKLWSGSLTTVRPNHRRIPHELADDAVVDLHILVADPDHFGLGAGSALLRWGMERAEQDGHKIFLDALVAARPVYLHLGFVDYGDSLIRVGQDKEFEAYPMVWRPSTYESPTAISP